MAQSFWQNARSVVQANPDDQLQQILALTGQANASPADIAALNAPPTAPISGASAPAAPGPRIDLAKKKTKLAAPAATPSAAQAVTAQSEAATPSTGGPAKLPPQLPLTALLPYWDRMEKEQDQERRNKVRAFFEDPKDTDTRIAGLMQNPEIAAQKKGNENYRDILAMEAERPSQTDLSGLMGMADILSNNKYSLRAGYKAPENVAERAKELLSNADKAQDNQRDLMKSIVSLANSGKAGMDQYSILHSILDENRQGEKTGMTPFRGNPTRDVQTFARQANTETKDLRSRGELLNSVLQMVNSNNPTALKSIPTLSARIIEGTVRPQLQVIGAEGGDPSWWQSLQNSLEKIGSGGSPAEQRAQYAALFSSLLNQHNKDVSGERTRLRAMYDRIPGANDSEFQNLVGDQWLDPHGGSSAAQVHKAPRSEKITGRPQGQPQGQQAPMTPADMAAAELKRRQAAKKGP